MGSVLYTFLDFCGIYLLLLKKKCKYTGISGTKQLYIHFYLARMIPLMG